MYPIHADAPRSGYGPGGSAEEPHQVQTLLDARCTPSETNSFSGAGPAISLVRELHRCSSTPVVSTLWGTQHDRFNGFTAAHRIRDAHSEGRIQSRMCASPATNHHHNALADVPRSALPRRHAPEVGRDQVRINSKKHVFLSGDETSLW